MKCMKNERLEAYQEKKILKKTWRNLWGLRLEWDERVWERKQRTIEREIKWNENQITWDGLNRNFSNARQMRYREVSRKLSRSVSRKCLSTVEVSSLYRAIRNQIQEQKLDWATKCREAIEMAVAFSIDPPGIEELLGLRYEKGLRSSTDSKVSKWFWGGIKPHFKTSFSRGEKHRHECNPTYNSINDPINIIISQNSLSI